MKCKTGLVALSISMVLMLSLPLGAQLQEAVKVPWPGFQIVEGRWQARNGTAVIYIKNINPTGSIDMQYVDLEAVHVTQAQAARDGKATRLTIWLRYSYSLCCLYNLMYDPQSDQLKGTFWRKGSSKTAEVVFERL